MFFCRRQQTVQAVKNEKGKSKGKPIKVNLRMLKYVKLTEVSDYICCIGSL